MDLDEIMKKRKESWSHTETAWQQLDAHEAAKKLAEETTAHIHGKPLIRGGLKGLNER